MSEGKEIISYKKMTHLHLNFLITDFTCLILMVFKSAMCFPTMLVSWLLVVGPGSGAAPAQPGPGAELGIDTVTNIQLSSHKH